MAFFFGGGWRRCSTGPNVWYIFVHTVYNCKIVLICCTFSSHSQLKGHQQTSKLELSLCHMVKTYPTTNEKYLTLHTLKLFLFLWDFDLFALSALLNCTLIPKKYIYFFFLNKSCQFAECSWCVLLHRSTLGSTRALLSSEAVLLVCSPVPCQHERSHRATSRRDVNRNIKCPAGFSAEDKLLTLSSL